MAADTKCDDVTRGLVRDKRTATNQLLCVVKWRSVFVVSTDGDVDGCGGGDDRSRDTDTLTDAPCRPAIIAPQTTATYLISGVSGGQTLAPDSLSPLVSTEHTTSGKFQRFYEFRPATECFDEIY